MQPRLYGRDPILYGLVPRLVGLAYDKQSLVPQEHREHAPVVLVTGRHGMGKTELLNALETSYDTAPPRLPFGRVDAAETAQARRPELAVSNTSDVVEILEKLVRDLARAVPGTGRLRFPRLLPGLFAVSSWHRGNEQQQRLARGRFGRLLADCGLVKGDATEIGRDWTDSVSEQLVGPNQQHDFAPVATAVVQQYFRRHTGARSGQLVKQWYQARSAGSDEGAAVLIQLSENFHRGGDLQYAVERTLVAAFLDDLSGAYGRWKRMNRRPRPLVLLDNAHTVAGQRVLDLLLKHRAEAVSGAADPLVVVATWLGGGVDRYPDAPTSEIPELVNASGWVRAVPGSPSTGLLVVPLTPLSRDAVVPMLQQAKKQLHQHLPSALYALTRGDPRGSRTLYEVIRASGQQPVLPEELPDLHTTEGQPVTELLLEQLVPQPQLRTHLTVLSLARDEGAAQALATATGIPGAELPAARYLKEEHWADGPGQRAGAEQEIDLVPAFVTDPFLRALLCLEARRSCAGADVGQRWKDLHGILRQHHLDGGAGHEADVLRHTLATGDADSVVARLTVLFRDLDAGPWLAMLRYVATAPHPPSAEWTDHRAVIARGERDRGYGETDYVPRSLNRLLHALWYLAETFAEPDSELCDYMGTELGFLSMHHRSGRTVLYQAARTWPPAARERRPYPR